MDTLDEPWMHARGALAATWDGTPAEQTIRKIRDSDDGSLLRDAQQEAWRAARDAARRETVALEVANEGYVKFADGTVVCLPCFEGCHSCPDCGQDEGSGWLDDGYSCECPGPSAPPNEGL